MVSLQMTRQLMLSEPQGVAPPATPNVVKSTETVLSQKRPTQEEDEQEAEKKVKAVESGPPPPQQLKPLEEDHIEQMIEELLDYGSIELCSAVTHNTQEYDLRQTI